MRAPLSWLKEYVDIELSVHDLANVLTTAGLEVEAVHIVGLPVPQVDLLDYELTGFEWERDKIVVAEIQEVMPHPNADRLVLCRLDDGDQVHTVLTGAPNLFPFKGKGALESPIKVCYAREGATIINAYEPGNKLTTLKRRKIRGVDSYSMACSERELGISHEHEGIIILDEDAPVGAALQDYMGDAVLDIAITPNMARNASILGIAREISALTGVELRNPNFEVLAEGPPVEQMVSIEIPDPTINPRFVLGLIENVTIQPSPYWVQRRLTLAGQRPLNNMVDATNYVMLEIGEPLHAFDYDVLLARARQAGQNAPIISTRLARAGEKLETLDGELRELDDFTVLVCDQSGPLALAGVMGGAESEVSEQTSRVLLEGASWNMINTRRTVMAQKLASEAAYRFSRGVHPALAPQGVRRGLEKMRQWCSPQDGAQAAVVYAGLVDEYPQVQQDPIVEITTADVERWLGLDLSAKEIAGLLSGLDFSCQVEASTIHVRTPDHRLDIGSGVIGMADLMEEIARIHGYDRIAETRMADELPPQKGNPRLEAEERVRDLLVDAGLQEIITYRLTTAEAEARRLAPDVAPADRPYLALDNPISGDRAVMRQSLLASVLEIVERNGRIRERIALFEIGEIFMASEAGDLPDEYSRLVIAMTGPRTAPAWQGGARQPMDFYDLKGVIEHLLRGLHLEGYRFTQGEHPSMHPGQCAHVEINSRRLGTFGTLHPRVAERYDLPAGPILIAKLNMEILLESIPFSFESEPVPVYPPVIEDVAFVVGEHIPAVQVESLIRQTGGRVLAEIRLFDVYRGDKLGAGYKSLAYRLTYQAADKTLTDQEVASLRERIAGRLAREVGARLRDAA